MYDIIKNLYYVTLLAILLQFVGLREPFAVLFGLTLLYFAIAELFMREDLDRLRRMGSISYVHRPDVSIAFIAMALCLGLIHILQGFHIRIPRATREILETVGSLGALYIFLYQYLPFNRGRRRRNLRTVR